MGSESMWHGFGACVIHNTQLYSCTQMPVNMHCAKGLALQCLPYKNSLCDSHKGDKTTTNQFQKEEPQFQKKEHQHQKKEYNQPVRAET